MNGCGWIIHDPHRLCGIEPAELYLVTAPLERLVQQYILLCELCRYGLEERGFLCEPHVPGRVPDSARLLTSAAGVEHAPGCQPAPYPGGCICGADKKGA